MEQTQIKETLQKCMTMHNLNKAQLARLIGISPWAIGAWLSGKRKVSSKYIMTIINISELPPKSDLSYILLVRELENELKNSKKMNPIDLFDTIHLVLEAASARLLKFPEQKVPLSLNDAIDKLLISYDEQGLSDLNQKIARQIAFNSKSNIEFFEECHGFEDDGYEIRFYIDEEDNILTMEYDTWMRHSWIGYMEDDTLDISSPESLDARHIFESHVKKLANRIFNRMEFKLKENTSWDYDKEIATLTLTYYAKLDQPRIKRNIILLKNFNNELNEYSHDLDDLIYKPYFKKEEHENT